MTNAGLRVVTADGQLVKPGTAKTFNTNVVVGGKNEGNGNSHCFGKSDCRPMVSTTVDVDLQVSPASVASNNALSVDAAESAFLNGVRVATGPVAAGSLALDIAADNLDEVAAELATRSVYLYDRVPLRPTWGWDAGRSWNPFSGLGTDHRGPQGMRRLAPVAGYQLARLPPLPVRRRQLRVLVEQRARQWVRSTGV